MEHKFGRDHGHRVVANISLQNLLSKTSSAKQFPDILQNQVKAFWSKMHHRNINDIVMSELEQEQFNEAVGKEAVVAGNMIDASMRKDFYLPEPLS